jgi:FkbM family methyltransferase
MIAVDAPPLLEADESNVAARLQDYVRSFEMNVSRAGNRYELLIRGFRPIPWRATPFASHRRRSNKDFHEEAATAAFSFFLLHRSIRTFMDVGAREGYFSRLALSYRARAIDVHAFEMAPKDCDTLAQKLAEVQQPGSTAKAMLCVISDRHLGDSTVWLSGNRLFENEPRPEDYRESLLDRYRSLLRRRGTRPPPVRMQVTITSIDEYCARNSVIPDAIKSDVDGYEAKVVPGGSITFRHHRPLVFLELHRRRYLGRFGVSRRDVVRPLFESGYRVLLFEDHRDRDAPIIPVTLESEHIDREETNMLIFY